MAVGRISGPLLKDNLLRNGVDLAFETSLLYLDVNNSRIGINTASPSNDLQVIGTTRTTNLTVDTEADIATFTVSGNTISSTSSTINLLPTGFNPVVYQAHISVGQLDIGANTIATTGLNTSLEITTTGIGVVNFNSNVVVYGDLHATGMITADGNIQLGNQTSDTVTFTGEVNSNILPNLTNTYDLGSAELSWNNLYVHQVNADTVTTNNLIAAAVQTANLNISGNTINTTTPNTDINFTTDGTGGIIFGNYRFYNNTITNISLNAVSEFAQTGSGYVKFDGVRGVVVPSGNASTDRPLPDHTELGMMRFNTDSQYLEIFNGTAWVNVAGSGGVSYSTATDIGIEAALIFG